MFSLDIEIPKEFEISNEEEEEGYWITYLLDHMQISIIFDFPLLGLIQKYWPAKLGDDNLAKEDSAWNDLGIDQFITEQSPTATAPPVISSNNNQPNAAPSQQSQQPSVSQAWIIRVTISKCKYYNCS